MTCGRSSQSEIAEVNARLKRFGAFCLDTTNQCLWSHGERIILPPKPYAVLLYLAEHAGRLVSHDELLDALWPETYVQPQVLRTYMLELRRILADDARSPRFIESLPKRGYCFVAEVSECSGEEEKFATENRAAHANSAASEHAHFLTGRERELALLHQCLQRAAAGTRQIVFVCGEAGIGKTALVEQFLSNVDDGQTAAVAIGQCISGFAVKQDYYPLCDALRQIANSAERKEASQILERAGTLSTERDASGEEVSTEAPSLSPGSLCTAIEKLAVESPLVLILEDLHWGDEATLDLLSALARRRGRARLMIVATFVPQCGSSSRSLARMLHDLRLRRLCSEIELPRLTRQHTARLTRQRLRQENLPQSLQDFVHQHSEGNPRFALTILDHLIAEGVLVRGPENGEMVWGLQGALNPSDAAVPDELARMIELEVEHLAPREQQLLEAGSLIPVAFPAWAVAAALDLEPAEAEEECNDLARRLSFMTRAGEDELPDGARSAFYVFAHGVYREVLYQRQASARRSIRHARIAERLRAMFRGREASVAREIAMHYEAAGDREAAIGALRVAAGRALEIRAFGEAADLQLRIARLSALLPLLEQQPIDANARDRQSSQPGAANPFGFSGTFGKA